MQAVRAAARSALLPWAALDPRHAQAAAAAACAASRSVAAATSLARDMETLLATR